MSEVSCPYCGHTNPVDTCDLGDIDDTHQKECAACEKRFVFTTEMHITCVAEKADCLNGGKHEMARTSTYPKEYAVMQCVKCLYVLPPTEKQLAARRAWIAKHLSRKA